MKATAFAPVNVALIKYWGKSDPILRLPANSSLSVSLTNLGTTTTVEWRENAEPKIITENNFPMSVGLSSSASGYAALTVAMAAAAGLKLSEKELSRLARLGSGSACRSIPGGWVEWAKGNDKASYGKTIFPANWWDLRILVVLLSTKPKPVSSSAGQKLAATSPYFAARTKAVPGKIKQIKQAIKQKNFTVMGEIMEADCLNMHQVMQTQQPPLNYLLPETEIVIQAIRQWRGEGLESYFTINTGQNVFVFCQPQNESKLVDKLSHTGCVIEVRWDKIGPGARLLA
ncbi:MAG: diphosphomevalonate decarboxylase [Patescibacteria group bacterium]|nr:diphosphomevalonate decarboxylase [Candidatus Beckwithbacteria bacterium]MDZ4228964.1 diphosphomevalonate decarboxylase [Patescibacteria group bacterium]